MLTDILLILLGVLLTAGTGIFVASEFALVTLDPAQVDRAVEEGDRGAVSVSKALRHLSTELSGAQVGITLTTVLLGYTTQPAISNLLAGWLGQSMLSEAAAATAAVVGAMILVNGFSMLFGELIPKNLALSVPMSTARKVAPLQRGFTTILRPLIVALNGSANKVLKVFGVELREELSGGRSAQELSSLVRRSAEVGTLDSGTARLLTRSIEFSDLTAVDVMTDRMRLVVVERNDCAADVIAKARATGHSRFPVVINGSKDDIVGFVNLRRAIAVPFERRGEVPAAALMIDAPRVPETARLGPLLVELRGQGLQMAIVVDEYGGTSGLVTLEDVVEEIVGDVADEHDPHMPRARELSAGSWSVDGTMRPDELKSRTGVIVPEDGAYETLGGFIMSELGRVPESGDEVEVPAGSLRVEAMIGRRVARVRVERREPTDEDDEDSGGSRQDDSTNGGSI